MNTAFVPFDEACGRARKVCEEPGILPVQLRPLYLVCDLFGRVRISVPCKFKTDEHSTALQTLAKRLHEELGAHSYPPSEAVLFVSDALLATLKPMEKEFERLPGVYWVDRLVTGGDWWTVGDARDGSSARCCTLFSVKGGVGRSTTAPAWMQDMEGDVQVAPAHGAKPGDYLSKLGRVYMKKDGMSWTKRLEHLITRLEKQSRPTIVLLESRSGLHDIAAATVTDLDAEVLLFATDSESTWTDYEILFRHWRDQGLAEKIRERLFIVSALTPVPDREAYMQQFRSSAWDVFRKYLYDEVGAGEQPGGDFSFDSDESDAPHMPLEISWELGLAAGASLRNPDEATVMAAYGRFLKTFVERIPLCKEEFVP